MTSQYPGWEFVETLGGGSFGKVYKARKVDAFGEDTFSAIKVMTIPEDKSEISSYRDDGMDDESITALLRARVKEITSEFKLLSKLRGNTNVVSYEDHEIIPHEDGQGWDIYIRMELLTALPNYISAKFDNGVPNDQTVIKLGIDICKALELCKVHNIIHRDIKPQNIFVNDIGDFKLGDFGIAKTADHSTRATKTGTYTYMAPEVYKDLPYHHSVDLYSLGLVLYWLLNERRGPFLALPPEPVRPGDLDQSLIKRMGGHPLPAPKHGSEDLKRVILKACSFQPRDRWSSATEMRKALEAVLAGRPVFITSATPQNIPAEDRTVAVSRPAAAPQAQRQNPIDATVGVRRSPVSQNNAYQQTAPSSAAGKAVQPPKKKGNSRIFAAIAAVLAVAVLIGSAYWFIMRDDDPSPAPYVPTVSNPDVEPKITEEITVVEEVTKEITDEEAPVDIDVATGFPACVTLRNTTALQGKKIGASIVYKGDEWCAGVAEALEKLGAYYGADIFVEDGDLNDECQSRQVENMIANDVDIIFCDPITPNGVGIALNQAYGAGIPIIIYDGYWTEGEKAITTVTWDQYQSGVLTAEYLLDHLRAEGKTSARIVELTNAVSTHCQERFEGLHDTFAAADDIEITILNKYDSQGNRETAYNAISAVVEPYDYVISDVDNGAMGAISALQAAGNTNVKVLSMGAYGSEPFGKLYNYDPNYLACLNVDAWILAQYIIDAAIDLFEGNEVPLVTNIALYMVDATNVEDFWKFY